MKPKTLKLAVFSLAVFSLAVLAALPLACLPTAVLPPVVSYERQTPPPDRKVTFFRIPKPVAIPVAEPPSEIEWFAVMFNGVKRIESYSPVRYRCPGGVATIGYGHVGKNLPKHVTKDEAERLLRECLAEDKATVLRVVKVPLTEHQLAALTSFTYNCGEASLRRLVNGDPKLNGDSRLNDGNYASVPRILPSYRMAGGKVLRGLELRRKWEVQLWNGNQSLASNG